MIEQILTRGVSTPLAISVILLIALFASVFSWFYYLEVEKEIETPINFILLKLNVRDLPTCNQRCESLGYGLGYCRTKSAIPDNSGKSACEIGEVYAGMMTSDCNVTMDDEGQMILGVYGGCCCEVKEVTNFNECVAMGYPVMESFPRQCRTPEGATFTEVIDIDK